MGVTLYQWTDASAPSLTGQVGSLTALLDAILVNGYGSVSAAGWSIAYTSTNKRQYAMASGGTGRQLYVDDTGPGGGGAKEARVTGWVGGSGLNAGTRQFPTTTQMTSPSGAVVWRKSNTADTTVRPWRAVADGHTLWLMLYNGDFTTPLPAQMCAFGDFFSYNAADVDNCHILGRTAENSTSFQYDWFCELPFINNNPSILAICPSGHYADANFTGVGGSVPLGHLIDVSAILNNNQGQGTLYQTITGNTVPNNGNIKIGHYYFSGFSYPYPRPADGSLVVSPYKVLSGGCERGYLKGCWVPLHDRPLNDGDTVTITGGPLNGKTLMAINCQCWGSGNNNDFGQVLIETSNTWA